MDQMLKLNPRKLDTAKQGMVCWDECGKTEIVQIFISHEKGTIKSIQFAYAEDGKVRLSQVHGDRETALNFEIVKLNYPSEYLKSFSGSYYKGQGGISIQFLTNIRSYGPYGGYEDEDEDEEEEDDDEGELQHFKYVLDKQSFGGFHGAFHNNRLYTMGVYIKPIDLLGGSLKK